MIRNAFLSVIALGFAACATQPEGPPPPATLSDAAFKPMLEQAFQTNKVDTWEKGAADLLARTDLTDNQRADVYFERRIKRGVFVESGTVATPQCAVADIDRAVALVPTGTKAEAATRDRAYQVSRYQYFIAPGNCD